MCTGGNAVEIKTEADSNDMTEYSHDDKPSNGVFHFHILRFYLFGVSALLSFLFASILRW